MKARLLMSQEKNNLYKKAKNQLSEMQKAFIEFDKSYILPRNHLNSALIGCYQASIEWEDEFIEKCCEQNNIKYTKKRCKNIVMLAMKVSNDCDERTKARVRTYVRVLKHLQEYEYNTTQAEEQLEKFGIDYFANPRKKKEKSEEKSNSKQYESDLDDNYSRNSSDVDEDDVDTKDISDDDLSDKEEEDDDDNNGKTKNRSLNQSLSRSSPKKRSSSTFSKEFIELCKKYDIDDENFVLWICEDNVQMSTDKKLIKRLEKQNYEFEDL